MSELSQRAAVLYLPLLALGLLAVWRKPDRRWAGALLLSFAWNAVAIVGLSWAASRAGWWQFGVSEPLWLGVPVDLLIGWAVLWGPLPALVLPGRPGMVTLAVLWFDLLFMPAIDDVLILSEGWIVGEFLGVALCVLPGLLIVKWTRDQVQLGLRVSAQFSLFAALNLAVVATVIGPTGAVRLAGASALELSLLVQVLAVPGVMAGAAVLEFHRVGRGTPYPYDPPSRMVASGPYAYVANPMQLGMTVGFMALAAFFGDIRLALAAAVAVAYSAGLAAWHEHGELASRFGDEWAAYRSGVGDWIPRWRPAPQAEPAEIYVSETCPLCAPIGAWLAARHPVGLRILPAESLSVEVNRASYRVRGDCYEGIAALAKALEHLNLGWALFGWFLLMPGVRQLIQLLLDALGAGPRLISRQAAGARTS